MFIVKNILWGAYIAIFAYIAPLVVGALITRSVNTPIIPLLLWLMAIVVVVTTYTQWSKAWFDGIIFAMIGSVMWYVVLINIYAELFHALRARGIATDSMGHIAEVLTLGGIPVLVFAVPFSVVIAIASVIIRSKFHT